MEYTIDSILTLISHLHSATADFTNRMLSKEAKFVSSHGFILFLLSENEWLTMGEISERINRDKSTTTVLIKKLFEEGLVQTKNCTEDSRKKYISLTAKGKEYNSLTSTISKKLLSVCYKGFSDNEKESLLHLLKKMNDNLENSSGQEHI